MIAEGLLPYLNPDEVRTLLRRLVDHVDGGELLFDMVSPWVLPPWRSREPRSGEFRWGLRDGREIERWDPRLRLLEQVSTFADHAAIPAGGNRRLFGLVNALPILRRFNQLYRVELGSPPASRRREG